MANIGDLYYTFRGDGARLQADAKVEGGKAGTTLGKSMSSTLKKSFSGQELGKGLVQGLGFAGALSGFALVSRAAGAFTDAIGDSIKAAQEDEVSQQKLRTTLEASIPAWDGNTDAIERVLKARMALGFSDDEQRVGLATLVTATHDITKALDLQRGAMDLARKRGISLADASDAIAKAYAGNTKGLKNLIPGLKLGATTAQTLANAFEAVSGQAEDYTKTGAGKMLVAQTQLNEKLENLGYKILPAIADGFATVIDIIGAFDGSIRDEVQSIEAETAAMLAHGGTLKDIEELEVRLAEAKKHTWTVSEQDSIARSAYWLGQYKDALTTAAGTAAFESKVINDRMDSLKPKPIEGMTAATNGFTRASEKAARTVPKSWDTIVTELVGKLTTLQSDFFDPLEAKEAQLEANRKLREGIESARTAKTSTEHHDAANAITSAIDDEITALADLQAAGNLTGKDVAKVQKDAQAGFTALGLKVPKDLQKIIDGWAKVAKLPDVNLNITAPGLHGIVQDYNSLFGNHTGHTTPVVKYPKPPVHAAGGYQSAGEVYRQNEHGFEATVPWNAYVMGAERTKQYMRDAISGASGGSGGDTNFNLTVAATSAARKPSDIVREVRIAARDGTLDPRRRR